MNESSVYKYINVCVIQLKGCKNKDPCDPYPSLKNVSSGKTEDIISKNVIRNPS